MSSADKPGGPLPTEASSDTNPPNPALQRGISSHNTDEYQQIPMYDSQYVPQRPNRAPISEERAGAEEEKELSNKQETTKVLRDLDQLQSSLIKSQEKPINQVKEENKQGEQDLPVSQIMHNIEKKLSMEITDDQENNLIRDSIQKREAQRAGVSRLELGKIISSIKGLVKETELDEGEENDLLNDLDNLEEKIGKIEIEDVGEQRLGGALYLHLIIQRYLHEEMLNEKLAEKTKVLGEDFKLDEQIKAIRERIETIASELEQHKNDSRREKDMLEVNLLALQKELENFEASESTVKNWVDEATKRKDNETEELEKVQKQIEEAEVLRKEVIDKLKEAKNNRSEANERDFELSEEIDQLKEKLSSLVDVETKFEEILKDLDKIATKIHDGEINIGELNRNLHESRILLKEESQKLENLKVRQEKEKKDSEAQKQELEQILRESKVKEVEYSKQMVAARESDRRNQEELDKYTAKLKGPGGIDEMEKDLNEKEQRYTEWEAQLGSPVQYQVRIEDLTKNVKGCIEEVKSVEGDYLRLDKEFQHQKKIIDEQALSLKLERKEKLDELDQKLDDVRKELEWGDKKKRTGPLANFCVAFANTSLVGILILGLAYIGNISVPGFE